MVNLHRWLKRTSPHLLIAGSLVMTGLSGCRSAQHSAVTLEPAHSAYSAPDATPILAPAAIPYTEQDAVPVESRHEPVLTPPPLPETKTGTETATGTDVGVVGRRTEATPFANGSPPRVPLPEDTTPEQLAPGDAAFEELTAVEPKSKNTSTDASGTVAVSDPLPATADPLDETNLFPDDAAKTTDDSSDSAGDVAVGEAVADVQEKSGDNVFPSPVSETDPTITKSFEPTLVNPEVPVPNPGLNTPSVNLPEAAAESAEPVQPEPVQAESVEPEVTSPAVAAEAQAAGETSTLFPLQEVKPLVPTGKAPNLPLSVDGDDAAADDATLESDNDAAASLPVITPAVVAQNTSPISRLDLPTPEAKTVTKRLPRNPSDAEAPVQDQLASIATPDGKLSTTDTRQNTSPTKPLFPLSSPSTTTHSDAISVVAEVWSPADNVVFDQAGNAFVSHGQHISKILPDGSVEPWATMGSPRSHAILPDGSHLICDAAQRAIVKLNADGEQASKVATRSDGHFLRAPNDLVVDSIGGIYFTDPGYARIRNAIGRIHYVTPDGSVEVVAQRLAFPEGIGLSPDGSKLLVVESQTRQIVSFEILSPGQVGPKQIFAELPKKADGEPNGFANGLIVDSKSGRVFVAHGERQQVEMFSPDGRVLQSFPIGASVNGVAFKSRDFSRIFATGGARSDKDAGQLFEIRIAD